MVHLKDLVPWAIRYRVMELRGRSLYSGYADAHRCIFVHIPKTAGTSVARALFKAESRHVRCVEYEKANPRKFRQYFKFSFVRNPWDRLHSAYHFLKNGGSNEDDRAWAQTHLGRFGTFEQFVQEWVNPANVGSWVHFRPQLDFITDAEGRVAMDYLGRLENIDADFESISRSIGISASLPKLNRVDKEPFTSAYTPEMIAIVRDAYMKDIEALGYTFSDFRRNTVKPSA